MRIDQLDLLKFGKFTDRQLAFPAAERDFHVIVGPNEAGKSTVRAAVQDLLFGIPARTVHGFVHPMPELRLGAVLQRGGATLALHRTKGNRNTLRAPDDSPLGEAALATFAAWLGGSDRDYFVQMFGLDHERLVQGGASILQASNDLGQVLFQSAAGIAGLGELRDQLQAEATRLWAPRRAADRAFYQASDALDAASAALKAATVRTRDWSAAHGQVTELQTRQTALRAELAALRTQRTRLERVRRVWPALQALQAAQARQAELQAAGPVALLPPEAAQTLARAETDIAVAQDALALHQRHQQDAAQALAALRQSLQADADLLARAADIAVLNDQRVRYAVYAHDIARRELEVASRWAQAQDAATALGWPADDEAALWARLPAAPLRATLQRMMRSHGALATAHAASAQAMVDKQDELARARQQWVARAGDPTEGGLPSTDTDTPTDALTLALQAALDQARPLGDVAAALRERAAEVERRSTALRDATAALGRWPMDLPALRALPLPAAATVEALLQAQRADAAEARSQSARAAQLREQIGAQQLAVAQYREAHQPVTRDDVLQARARREAAWQQLSAQPATLPQAGPAFEALVQQADRSADARHDTVQEAAELQSRQQQLARLQQEAAAVHERLTELAAAEARRDHGWAAQMAACGLTGLTVADWAGWAEARQRVLAAADARAHAEQAQRLLTDAATAAHAALLQPLAAQGVIAAAAVDATPLTALPLTLLQAEAQLRRRAEARVQRQALAQQLAAGEAALARLTPAHASAAAALQAWQGAWAQALAQAHLQGDPEAVSAALALIEQLDACRHDMRQLRVERIATMRADLAEHARAARHLALALDPAGADRSADDVALHLAERLQRAQQAQAEHQRQQAAQQQAQARADDAETRLRAAQAGLQPLRERAGVSSLAALAQAIARSDQLRQAQAAQTQAEAQLRDGGDGLDLAALQAECTAFDPLALPAALQTVTRDEAEAAERLSALAVELKDASTALGRIAGQAEAATAEARRQEALAAMADAVQRYVKVQTGARLLKWAVERYREARQGPMLTRASAVFAALTLGSFERLTVDFDTEPLQLQGRRADGQRVDIAGLSEGTRDQLYLALRLAALHLHLDPMAGAAGTAAGQPAHPGVNPEGGARTGHPLPFIADDLFINYDDRRACAGLQALGELSRHTQVLFLTHHDHLLPQVREVFGAGVNVVTL
jgi:uncharacterized protein YhaN